MRLKPLELDNAWEMRLPRPYLNRRMTAGGVSVPGFDVTDGATYLL